MKKNILCILLCMIAILFASCENNDNENTKQEGNQIEISTETETKVEKGQKTEEDQQEIENKITDESQINTDKNILEAVPLNFNKAAKTDFVKIKFKSVSMTDELKPSNPDSYYHYLPDNEKEKYIVLKGTIKNIGTEKFEFADSSYKKVIIDDKYTYDATVTAIEESNEGNDISYIYAYLDPLVSETFYITASIPDELAEKYKKATFEYGFTENFNKGFLERQDCKYIYSLTATK